jgi:hypothetical protein
MQLPSCIKEKRKEEIRYERQEILEKETRKAKLFMKQNKTKQSSTIKNKQHIFLQYQRSFQ